MNRELPAPLGSFSQDDVILLLKDVTGLVEERDTALREREIQAGRHYSEDLPVEQAPSEAYMRVFNHLVETKARQTALYTGIVTRLMPRALNAPCSFPWCGPVSRAAY